MRFFHRQKLFSFQALDKKNIYIRRIESKLLQLHADLAQTARGRVATLDSGPERQPVDNDFKARKSSASIGVVRRTARPKQPKARTKMNVALPTANHTSGRSLIESPGSDETQVQMSRTLEDTQLHFYEADSDLQLIQNVEDSLGEEENSSNAASC